MERPRRKLTQAEVEDLLPDGEYVHTFINPSGQLVGVDWKRQEVLELLQSTNGIELAGDMARSLKHGMAHWSQARGWLFIQTKEDANYEQLSKVP